MVYNEFRFLGGAAQQFEIDNKQQCCAAQQSEVDVGEQLLSGPSLVGCGPDLVVINAVLLGVALIDVSLYLSVLAWWRPIVDVVSLLFWHSLLVIWSEGLLISSALSSVGVVCFFESVLGAHSLLDRCVFE